MDERGANRVKILWVSNYESHSGYSVQARLIVPRLKAAGHDVNVLAIANGVHSQKVIDGVRILPTSPYDTFGNDVISQYTEYMDADAVLTLTDAWVFQPEKLAAVNAFCWTPIDHDPPPPRVMQSLKAAKGALVMSRGGAVQVDAAKIPAMYLPLAYDPATFYPESMSDARLSLALPAGAFVVSFVGVNDSVPSRKGIGELLIAWQAFSRDHADAVLYLHTTEYGANSQHPAAGIHIQTMLKTLNLEGRVLVVNQDAYRIGIPPAYLRAVYNASDALILPSRGEGFGLPLLEAQACGCPVMTTNFGAQKELCASGWFIEGESAWSPQGSFQIQPSVSSIVDALETAYAQRGNPLFRQQAAAFAEGYRVNEVFGQYWRLALEWMREHADT